MGALTDVHEQTLIKPENNCENIDLVWGWLCPTKDGCVVTVSEKTATSIFRVEE